MTVTWGGRARARLGALAFVVALAACNGSEKVQQTPRLMEVGSFVGQVDVLTGAMTITSTGADPFPMGLVFRNTLEEIPVSQNGIWGDVGEGAVEMRGLRATATTSIEGCSDGFGGGQDIWEMDVEIHSGFTATRLVRPYVEITSIDQLGFDSCFSAPVPANPPELAISDVYGLFLYPDMEPLAVSTATWSFKVGTGTNFTFYGRVLAERVDLAAPTTTASVPPGTYTAPQLLTLTCSDGTGSDTGCANTYYSADGVTTTYVGPVHLSGAQSICYWSDDLRGNVESNHHCGTYTTTMAGATALYDSTLHVPKCGSIASSCDTGTLVVSRGTMGTGEPNQPNVLDNCAEGSGGTYQTSESLERLVLRTDDGGPLQAGRPVHVDGYVYANAAQTDRFEVYWASTTTAPAWQQVGSTQVAAAGGGAQTLSVGFTMPAGAVAIRGRFGPANPGTACQPAALDDQDDLVFTPDAAAAPSGAPSVTLSLPKSRPWPETSTPTVSGDVLVAATVPVDADVHSVEFFVDDGSGQFTSIGVDRGPPWAISWIPEGLNPSVDIRFQARVTDRAEATADSAILAAKFLQAPPSVTVASPLDGDDLAQSATIPVTVHAVTQSNFVLAVQLFVDGAMVGQLGVAQGEFGPDYVFTWNASLLSTTIRHTLYARALTTWGSVLSQSLPVHVTLH